MKNKLNIWIGLIVIGAFILGLSLMSVGGRVNNGGGSSYLGNQFGSQSRTTPSSQVDLIDDDAILGDADAPITLIEFGDYQCSFCTRFFNETEPELIEKYVKTGKMKIVFRDLPINGRESQKAAEAAECAGDQGKYWEFHDKLFSERRGYNVGVFVEENLKRFAKDLGLDEELFDQCYDSGKFKREIAKDAQDASRLGVRGTPNFFLNGRQIVGAQPLSVFESLIEELLN